MYLLCIYVLISFNIWRCDFIFLVSFQLIIAGPWSKGTQSDMAFEINQKFGIKHKNKKDSERGMNDGTKSMERSVARRCIERKERLIAALKMIGR